MHFGIAKFIEKKEFPKFFIIIGGAIIRLAIFLQLLEVLTTTSRLLFLEVSKLCLYFCLILGDSIIEKGFLAGDVFASSAHRNGNGIL